METLYLVTIDGGFEGEAQYNALGIFTTLEQAQNAVDQIDILVKNPGDAEVLKRYSKITEIKKDVIYQIKVRSRTGSDVNEYGTDAYIGGEQA